MISFEVSVQIEPVRTRWKGTIFSSCLGFSGYKPEQEDSTGVQSMRINSRINLLSLASIGILSLFLPPVAFAEEAASVKTPPATETVSPIAPSTPPATSPASDAAPAQTGSATGSASVTADGKAKAVQEKVKANVPADAAQAKGDKTSAQNAFVNSFTNGFGSGSTTVAPKAKVQTKPQTRAVNSTYDPYAAYRRGYSSTGSATPYYSKGYANNSGFQTGNNARSGVFPRPISRQPFPDLTGGPNGLGQQLMNHQQEQRQAMERIGSQYRK